VEKFLSRITPQSFQVYYTALKHYESFTVSRGNKKFIPDLKPPRKPRRVPTYLTVEQINKMFEYKGRNKIRNLALLALVYACGLRRSEAADVKGEDILEDSQEIRVFGKGSKERTTPIADFAWRRLLEWFGPGPIPKGSIFKLGHEGVYSALKMMARKAGISPFHPHELRASFATHLLDGGADIHSISKLLGHASLGTTEAYIASSQSKRRDEYNKAFPKL
jgi:site-specific recombinase XerD